MNWETKRITVITKAYPEESSRHGTVACTAGITNDGEWIRLYPVDMRYFVGANKISKFDVIEVECAKDNDKLSRKESHKIRPDSLQIVDRSLTSPKVDWTRRNKLLFPLMSDSVESLEHQYTADKTSLGMVKPNVIDFLKTDALKIYEQDRWAFTVNLKGEKVPVVTKIPHLFKYRFTSGNREHTMQCEDWELLESYRSWGATYENPEILWEKLKYRYFAWMQQKRDLYFIMGTHSQYPTWFIIGIYYPPKNL